MVALRANQVPAFLKRPDPEAGAVLLHGNDAGLVAEYAETLARALAHGGHEPGEIIRLDDAALAEDPERLFVELRTGALFGGARVVRLKAGPRLKPAVVEELLRPGANAAFLIVEAGNLKRDSKLRRLFEESKSAVAIACYGDDAKGIERLVDEVLAGYGLTLAPDARPALVALLGGDRGLARSELEKLALYGYGKASLTLDDVTAVVGNVGEAGFGKVVAAAAEGRTGPVLCELERLIATGQSPQGLLIALLRHFARLHRVQVARAAGQSLEAAIKGLRPPVFFKELPAFTQQCRNWRGRAIEGVLRRIQATMRASRTRPELEAQLVATLVIGIAESAAGKGGGLDIGLTLS